MLLLFVCMGTASSLTHLDKNAAWRNALGAAPKSARGFLAPLEDFDDDDVVAHAALSLVQDGVELSTAGNEWEDEDEAGDEDEDEDEMVDEDEDEDEMVDEDEDE